MKRQSIFLAVFISILLASCVESMFFEQNTEIPNAQWSSDEPIVYTFDVDDTIQRYDFFIDLRNKTNYPYSNLFVFVELEYPNGKKRTDTLECPLADATGKWYGSGLGDLLDNKFAYSSGVSLPLKGQYKISINQAMRNETLEGIQDVGFSIGKHQQN